MVNGYNGLHSHSIILQNISKHVMIQEYATGLAPFHAQKQEKNLLNINTFCSLITS